MQRPRPTSAGSSSSATVVTVVVAGATVVSGTGWDVLSLVRGRLAGGRRREVVVVVVAAGQDEPGRGTDHDEPGDGRQPRRGPPA